MHGGHTLSMDAARGVSVHKMSKFRDIEVQCPLDIATLDKAAALPIATSTPVTDLRHYINSNLGYSNLKLLGLMY